MSKKIKDINAGKMKLYTVKVEDLIDADYNPNVMEERDFENLENSIERYGYIEPIIVNKRNNVIVGGHHRLRALKKKGIKEVDIVYVDLDENDEKRLNIALNRISGYWDIDKLEEVVNDLMADDPSLIDFTGLSEFELDSMFGVEEVDFLDKDGFVSDDDTYVREIKTPIYEITGKEPEIYELCDHTKTDELINNINDAFEEGLIDKKQQEFLIRAAQRHLVFNYANIAEYYAHQDKNMQDLMEQSALIILDVNSAIKNGFITLSQKMSDLLGLDEPENFYEEVDESEDFYEEVDDENV